MIDQSHHRCKYAAHYDMRQRAKLFLNHTIYEWHDWRRFVQILSCAGSQQSTEHGQTPCSNSQLVAEWPGAHRLFTMSLFLMRAHRNRGSLTISWTELKLSTAK